MVMKKIVGIEIILSYPFFSGYFIIHTDAGNLQLGVVINHNRNTIDFYSRKLTPE